MATASSEELVLHNRLLSGDATASAEIFNTYLELIVHALRQKFPEVAIRDQTLIWDAATDALFNYIKVPTRFDPERSQLLSYLKMSARGDLLNSLDRLKREQAKITTSVELEQVTRNKSIEAHSVEDDIDHQKVWAQICQVVTDPLDQEFVKLMINGVRSYDTYAEIIGVAELPTPQMRKAVKKNKDRLKARLKRANWSGIIEPNK